jgi:acyl carrier protein
VKASVEAEIVAYLEQHNPHGVGKKIHGATSLFDGGLVDSFGIIELVSFLEGRFGVRFDERDLAGENFKTVNSLVDVVVRKTPKVP